MSPRRAAQDVTRLINERNESEFARKATQSGGSLTVVRGARARGGRASRHGSPNHAVSPSQIRPPPDAQQHNKAKAKPSLKAGHLGKQ